VITRAQCSQTLPIDALVIVPLIEAGFDDPDADYRQSDNDADGQQR
jgi:hypothetical protein